MFTFKNLFAATTFIFCIAAASSCKKHAEEQKQPVTEIPAAVAPANGCKPEVLASYGAAYVNGVLQVPVWTNIMQKWYDALGRVAYIKADLGWGFDELIVTDKIEWGVVTYLIDTLYVLDVVRHLPILGVKLDNFGRPLKSYYLDVDGDEKATYAYNQASQLATITLNKANIITTLTFTYDKGDLKMIESQGNYFMRFTYDYSKPVTGMLGLHAVNKHLKLMEYMDLLNMPLNYELVSVTGSQAPLGPNNDAIVWDYRNIRLFGSLIYSYKSSLLFFDNVYYVGWTCDDIITRANKNVPEPEINSPEEFMRRYPQSSIYPPR
jgi:hypothetical protein